MHRKNVIVLSLLIITCCTINSQAAEVLMPLDVKVYEISQENNVVTTLQKNVTYGNQGYFFIRKINFKASCNNYSTSYTIPGNSGIIQYYNEKQKLITKEIKSGILPLNTVVYIKTDTYNMIIGQPYSYTDLGNGTIQSDDENCLPIKITKKENSWLITNAYMAQKDHFGILWGVGSKLPLVDFSNESTAKIWSKIDLSKNSRFSIDGYYYKSPTSYTPTAPTAYWRNPSMYIVNLLVKTGGSLASDMIGNAMMLIATSNLNDQGFFPTLPQSNWLQTDYQIGAGFYDTRFNADAGEVYLLAYRKFSNPIFLDTYLKMIEFYMQHAAENHYTVMSTDQKEGWLVEDYGSETGLDTHVALNHQLQDIHWLLLAYQQERDVKYLDIANLLLQGIKNTRDLWIKEDHNLEYSYRSDGTLGGNDYPCLTYNDLFNVQQDLEQIYGMRDEDLDVLMASKKLWMDAQGITDYKKG